MTHPCPDCDVLDGQQHNVWCPSVHRKTIPYQSVDTQSAPLQNPVLPPVPLSLTANPLNFEDESSWEEEGIFRRDLKPGSASWSEGYKAINFTCPCGCGVVHCIPVEEGIKKTGAWLWDGNVQNPTLDPSMRRNRGCQWHGYLTKGMLETCADWRPPA